MNATLHDALAAVRGADLRGLKLSRVVAYAIGGGDPTSRTAFEKYGPTLTVPGESRARVGWLPPRHAEDLEGASAVLPKPSQKDAPPSERWALMSGTHPDGRAFARAWKGDGKADGPTINVTKAENEVLARLDAALQAQIWEAERRPRVSAPAATAAAPSREDAACAA